MILKENTKKICIGNKQIHNNNTYARRLNSTKTRSSVNPINTFQLYGEVIREQGSHTHHTINYFVKV